MNRVTAQAVLSLVFGLGGAAMLLSGAGTVLSASKPLPFVLESGSNDVIRLRLEKRMKPKRRGGAAVPSPRLPVPFSPSAPSAMPKAGLVTLCLKNASESSRTKAFDIRRSLPPRYLARPGGQVCAAFVPTRQTLYFWKSDEAGKLVLSLSSPLDLGMSAGGRILLTWVQDCE